MDGYIVLCGCIGTSTAAMYRRCVTETSIKSLKIDLSARGDAYEDFYKYGQVPAGSVSILLATNTIRETFDASVDRYNIILRCVDFSSTAARDENRDELANTIYGIR